MTRLLLVSAFTEIGKQNNAKQLNNRVISVFFMTITYHSFITKLDIKS